MCILAYLLGLFIYLFIYLLLLFLIESPLNDFKILCFGNFYIFFKNILIN